MKNNYINISSTNLGGTLFIPATHKNLFEVVEGKKYPNLKSVLIDCEDSINNEDLELALQKIKQLLLNINNSKCLVFIRPRDIEILKEILTYDGVEKIDGFILPKFSLQNAEEYLSILESSSHCIMPSIEGEELFDNSKLMQLKNILKPYSEKIILIRFGLEDMLRQLKMRRECSDSIFDYSVSSTVLGNFIAIFKSAGFSISGGVYPCFNDSDGFKRDLKRDLKEGLFSKTIIHPNQIAICNEIYKVSQREFDEALEICESFKSVFSQNSKMVEKVTMLPYSREILLRAEIYGIRDLS